jgi:hypothetical protein
MTGRGVWYGICLHIPKSDPVGDRSVKKEKDEFNQKT